MKSSRRTTLPLPGRRAALIWSAACFAIPWSRAQGQDIAVPPFSAGTPGTGIPSGWRHETLPKVERANDYELTADAGATVLRVRSSSSASTLITAPPAASATPRMLQWRWKVSKALAGSDFRSRQGDDYSARLYVLFDLPQERLTLGDRLRIQAARTLAGRDIPAAAICYVWGNAQPAGATGWNPYTDRVRMVVVDSGNEHAQRWRNVQRDLERDWGEAFAGPMPPVRALAVGADTDNTGDSVDAWFGDLRLSASR
jgi:hypothetical protein